LLRIAHAATLRTLVSTDLTFGARLRSQRERQNVSLSEIADQTKIKRSLLEALERDDVTHWPTGIFRRSYLRAYARAIDLDAEATVREFLELHPDPEEDVTGALADAHRANGESKSPPTRLRYLIDSAMATLPRLQAGARTLAQRVVAEPANGDLPLDTALLAMPRRQVSAMDLALQIEPDHARLRDIGLPFPGSASAVGRHVAADEVAASAREVDLLSVAGLCTRLGCAVDARDIGAVLDELRDALDAEGLILWLWDPPSGAMTPALARGYGDQVLAMLTGVPADADNAVGAAFRSAATCIVDGRTGATGAVVTPLVTPSGCSGVLALEFRGGGEHLESIRASAEILAAQLSTLLQPPVAVPHAATA
jgi:transcriptional regulator with XRE-family HTH domain